MRASASSSDLMNDPEVPASITENSPLQEPRLTTMPGRAMIVSRRPVTTESSAKSIICSSPWPHVVSMAGSLAEYHESPFQSKKSNIPSFSLHCSSATALSLDYVLLSRLSDVGIGTACRLIKWACKHWQKLLDTEAQALGPRRLLSYTFVHQQSLGGRANFRLPYAAICSRQLGKSPLPNIS